MSICVESYRAMVGPHWRRIRQEMLDMRGYAIVPTNMIPPEQTGKQRGRLSPRGIFFGSPRRQTSQVGAAADAVIELEPLVVQIWGKTQAELPILNVETTPLAMASGGGSMYEELSKKYCTSPASCISALQLERAVLQQGELEALNPTEDDAEATGKGMVLSADGIGTLSPQLPASKQSQVQLELDGRMINAAMVVSPAAATEISDISHGDIAYGQHALDSTRAVIASPESSKGTTAEEDALLSQTCLCLVGGSNDRFAVPVQAITLYALPVAPATSAPSVEVNPVAAAGSGHSTEVKTAKCQQKAQRVFVFNGESIWEVME